MTTPPIALITARAARHLDEDLPPLERALERAHAPVEIAEWDDERIDWSRYVLAVLRSTWDYTERLDEFVRWAARASQATRFVNPLPVVKWNTDKHYLAELAGLGVATIPSAFIEPGEDCRTHLLRFLAAHRCAEIVVKPAVGAGSRDTERHARDDLDGMVSHASRLLAQRRSVLLQPYLDSVDRDGETALMYFGGTFSHAIRKGPILKAGATQVAGLFAAEDIVARAPQDDELRLGARTLAALPFAMPLYARVDMIRDADGSPRLLELELTEPSLFFAHAEGAAERFAHAILVHAAR